MPVADHPRAFVPPASASVPSSASSRQAAAGRSGLRARRARGDGARKGTRWARFARCGSHRGGRRYAPTALRSSPRGRAAELAARAALAALGQPPRVRVTKRASRADPEAAVLGAAEVAAPSEACPPRALARPTAPGRRARNPDRPAAACRSACVRTAACAARTAALTRKGAGRLPRVRLCAGEKRSSAGARAKRASYSFSPRLSERSARSARSELRGASRRCEHRSEPPAKRGAAHRRARGRRPVPLRASQRAPLPARPLTCASTSTTT